MSPSLLSCSELLLFISFIACFLVCNGAPLNLWRTELDDIADFKTPDEVEYENVYHDKHTPWVIARDVGNSSSSNNSTNSLEDCKTSGLCPEGIANIVAGLTAISFLAILACILWHWEVQSERKTRIKMALERNEAIDRQMAEEKIRRQERVDQFIERSQEESKTVGVERDHTPQVEETDRNLQDMTSDSELSSDERKELLSNRPKTTDKVTVMAEVVSS